MCQLTGKKSLSPSLTLQDMMALDYRYHYTDIELLTDWRGL